MSKKASELLLESAEPFDAACIKVIELEEENAALKANLSMCEAELAQSTSEHRDCIERVKELEKGLIAIKKHLELIGGNAVSFSSVYMIATKALREDKDG